MKAAAAILAKAGSTDADKLIAAAEGLKFDTPFGEVTFRAIDHQSTLGAFVGKTALKDGKGVMVDVDYHDGADYLPPEEHGEGGAAEGLSAAVSVMTKLSLRGAELHAVMAGLVPAIHAVERCSLA